MSPHLRPLCLSVLLLSCGGDRIEIPTDQTPLPLDEPLAAGEVRAGLITQESELIGGVTADGEVGDFKIYNSEIEVIIGHPTHAAGYNPYGGTVLDVDLARPPGEPGRSAYGEVLTVLDLKTLKADRIEVIDDGRDGTEARIRVHGVEGNIPLIEVLTRSLSSSEIQEVDFNVDYVLEPNSRRLKIEYSVFNKGTVPIEYGGLISGFLFGDGTSPFVEGFGYRLPSGGEIADYFGAVGDGVSYVYGRPEVPLSIFITQSGVSLASHGREFILRARDTFTFTHELVVGEGDLNKNQRGWRRLVGDAESPMLRGLVAYDDGTPIAGARVHAVDPSQPDERDYVSTALTDENGLYEMELPGGNYVVRPAVTGHSLVDGEIVDITTSDIDQNFSIPRPGFVRYFITDTQDRSLPSRITVRQRNGRVNRLPSYYGELGEPGGVVHTEYAVTGNGAFPLAAGEYDLWISRGAEYSVEMRTITIEPTQEQLLNAKLDRVVSTPGWMSTDTHIHSQLSPDSPDLFEFKVAAMVVEGLEIPISTEHEALGDFNPAIESMGLQDWMKGIIGSEITTFAYGHFNAWPLKQNFAEQGNGRIDWYYKAPKDTFAAIRANAEEPFIQVNHPRGFSLGGYFSAMQYDRDTGTAKNPDFSMDWDGIEVANGCGSNGIEREEAQDWFSFLNAGHRRYGLGSTDNHKARPSPLGYPRTYVKMPTDEPRQADPQVMKAAMVAGRIVISCGPYLEVTGPNGELVGDTLRPAGDSVAFNVRVAAAGHIDVDRVQVVVNGVVVDTVPVGDTTSIERFNGVVSAAVPAGRDSWVVIYTHGDDRHTGWSRSQPSWAMTNPFFIDGDGDGAWTMRP